MNGAEILIKTLIDHQVEVCFANPGMAETHIVAALQKTDKIRQVLALFPGVATGAADGYGRMTGRPAATLLHLGAGLFNAASNLYHAKQAKTPLLNIVGDHPPGPFHHDAHVPADTRSIAGHVSDGVYSITDIRMAGSVTAKAIQAASADNGQVVTLIMPSNVACEADGVAASALPETGKAQVDEHVISGVRELFKKRTRIGLLLRGEALQEQGLNIAGKIAETTGTRLLSEALCPRIRRGAGYPQVERIPCQPAEMRAFFKEMDVLILVGTAAPEVSSAPSSPTGNTIPDSCKIVTLAHPHEDTVQALTLLANRLNVYQASRGPVNKLALPDLPDAGPLNAERIVRIVSRLLPPETIVCDESASANQAYYHLYAAVQPHDMLQLTGGSAGSMLPVSIGAAIGCPQRKVVCQVGDGSAMYTIQALWTIAREQLDITVVVYSNRSYASLQEDLNRIGSTGKSMRSPLYEMMKPDLNWIKLSESMGIAAAPAETTKEFYDLFKAAMSGKTPFLIEAML